VQWAGASGDFFELHYDKEFAKTMGYPNVLVHGRLEAAYLTQLLTDWAGEKGVVKKMSVQYRGNAFPGQKLLIKGKVTKKYQKDNENIVELEIFVENPEGQKITPGSAIVALPRNKPDLHKDQTLGGKTQG
jgi:acyl dehydratase